MRRRITIAAAAAVFAACCGTAFAGVFGRAGGWFTTEVAALALSALLALLGGALGLAFRKAARTFREAGEFLAQLGAALEDNRLTREELAAIIREGREVFAVWR